MVLAKQRSRQQSVLCAIAGHLPFMEFSLSANSITTPNIQGAHLYFRCSAFVMKSCCMWFWRILQLVLIAVTSLLYAHAACRRVDFSAKLCLFLSKCFAISQYRGSPEMCHRSKRGPTTGHCTMLKTEGSGVPVCYL